MQKTKAKGTPKDRTQMILLGIIGAAVVVAILAIVISATGINPNAITLDYSSSTMARQDDGGFVVGNSEAPVTIVVFEDFRCPHCQSYQSELKQFIRDYVFTGKARFEFRMMATSSGTDGTLFTLAECAEQVQAGLFWPAHDELFEMASRGWRNDTGPREFAQKFNLNYSSLLDCQATARQYQVDGNLARSLGVTGTPSLMVRIGNDAPRFEPTLGPRPSASALADFINNSQ
jgi:protein-disulfide isomerase